MRASKEGLFFPKESDFLGFRAEQLQKFLSLLSDTKVIA
jgi:hypothetical protein